MNCEKCEKDGHEPTNRIIKNQITEPDMPRNPKIAGNVEDRLQYLITGKKNFSGPRVDCSAALAPTN